MKLETEGNHSELKLKSSSDENKKTKINKILKIIGYIITFASVLYILWHGYENWNRITSIFSFKNTWQGILYAAFFYTAMFLLIALAWKIIITSLNGKITFKNSFIIYGRSNIAKYIPGNVFHFVGRGLMCREIGINANIVINGIFLETLLLVIATGLIAIPSLIIYGTEKIAFLNTNRIIFIVVVIIILLIAIAICIKFIPFFKTWLIKRNLLIDTGTISFKTIIKSSIFAIIIYFFYYGFVSLILFYLSNYFWLLNLKQFFIFLGAYSLGWLLGFITPGAPGGLGVREAVITGFLTPFLGASRALILALVFRLITIFGDFLFFLVAYILNLKKSGNSQELKLKNL